MKKVFSKKSISPSLSLLLAVALVFSFASCKKSNTSGNNSTGHIDYAASVKLDPASGTAQQEVTVNAYVDGDTTHFKVPSSVMPGGILKGRYLGINTPESTGKIEEWGKTAAQFTKTALQSATSIIIESDTATWDADSTGGRYLVWVWYKTADSADYRNLNIEILQQGLAVASSSANNRYGDTCMKAINQARAEMLHVYSGQKDPNFPYGQAAEVTIKEIRTNIASYDNTKVAFEGVITKNSNQSVYVEDYDAETDMYYGMAVYYGYALYGTGLEILTVGNRVRIVGSVQYYETGGTYQVSGLEYSPMRPNDPNNIQELSEGHDPAYTVTDPAKFNSGRVELTIADEKKSFSYAELSMSTSVEMKNLRVVDTYTTSKEDSSSKGAITLTCKSGNETIDVRTVVLYDDNGKLVTADRFEGKTISVRGIVDKFDGDYQIKVFSLKDITIH